MTAEIISISFLPRDAMHSAVFAVVRCQSVCPSEMLVYCIETAKLTIKLFSSPGGPIILISPQESGDPTVKFRRGHSLQHARQIEVGYQKFAIFQPISYCVSDTMPERAIVTMER